MELLACSPAMPNVIIACSDCGAVQQLPPSRRGHKLICWRCAATLERVSSNTLDRSLALALATLLMLFPANLMTLLHITIAGAERSSVLSSGIVGMAEQGWPLLAIVVGLQGVIFPFARFGLLSAALATIQLDLGRRWSGRLFRWAERLDLWAMPDVFLIGAAIGYSRVAARVPIVIGPGGWFLIAAAVLAMLTRVSLDRQEIWRLIGPPRYPHEGEVIGCRTCDFVVGPELVGQPCPRCRAIVWRRRPLSLMRSTALVAAGYLLYPVANYFPMSVQIQLGEAKNHTIAAGIEQLFGSGFWPLGVVIFCTSIAIPLLKLCGLTWLIWTTHQHSPHKLVLKTRMYRVITEIGRWSNVDVFTVAVFLPILQFGSLLSVHAGAGAPAFLAVIVLTMLAVRIFDPRLMWDAARPAT
jgi:paraquat-inducible protein A